MMHCGMGGVDGCVVGWVVLTDVLRDGWCCMMHCGMGGVDRCVVGWVVKDALWDGWC